MDTLTDYGLWGIIGAILLRELWPFLRDKWYPDYRKDQTRLQDALIKVIQDNTTAINILTERIGGRDVSAQREAALVIDHLSDLREGLMALRVDLSEVCMRLNIDPPSKKRPRVSKVMDIQHPIDPASS